MTRQKTEQNDLTKLYEDGLKGFVKSGTLKNYLTAIRQLPNDFLSLPDDEAVKIMNEKISKSYDKGNTAHIKRSAYILLLKLIKKDYLELRLLKRDIKARFIRKKFLPFSIFKSVMLECRDDIKLITMLQYDSCSRVSTILNIDFSDIDFENKKITITETKTEDIRTVTLSDESISLLKEFARKNGITNGRIFNIKYGNVWKFQKQAFIKIMGNEGRKISTHWARSSRAVHLLQAGYDLDTIMRLGGWKSVDSLMKYLKESGIETEKVMKENPVKW